MKINTRILLFYAMLITCLPGQVRTYVFPSESTINDLNEDYFLPKSLSPSGRYAVIAKWNSKLRFLLADIGRGEKIEKIKTVRELGGFEESVFPALNIYWSKNSDFFVIFTAKNKNDFDNNDFHIYLKNGDIFSEVKFAGNADFLKILKAEYKSEVQPELYFSKESKALILSSRVEKSDGKSSDLEQRNYFRVDVENGLVTVVDGNSDLKKDYDHVVTDAASDNQFYRKKDVEFKNLLK